MHKKPASYKHNPSIMLEETLSEYIARICVYAYYYNIAVAFTASDILYCISEYTKICTYICIYPEPN